MSFDDFYECFKFLDICKIEKDYKTSRLQIKREQAKEFQILKLKVDKDKEYKRTYIQLYKKNLRIVRKENFHHSYNAENNFMGFIILAKCIKYENGDELKYVNSIAGYETHLAIEADLTEGEYFIFCDVNYRYYNQERGYTITCYHKSSETEPKLNLKNVTKEKKDRKRYLELVLSDYFYDICSNKKLVKKNKKKDFPFTNENKNGCIVFIKDSFNDEIMDKKFPFYILCFKNNTNDKIFKIETTIKNRKSAFFYNEVNEEINSISKTIEQHEWTTFLIMNYNIRKSIFFPESIKYSVVEI
jgi:hypothetical protein